MVHQDQSLCLSPKLSHVTIHLRSFLSSHLQMHSIKDLIQMTVWFLLQLVQFDFQFLKQLAHHLPLPLTVLLANLLEVELRECALNHLHQYQDLLLQVENLHLGQHGVMLCQPF